MKGEKVSTNGIIFSTEENQMHFDSKFFEPNSRSFRVLVEENLPSSSNPVGYREFGGNIRAVERKGRNGSRLAFQ
jgi:hypothetical protein